MPDAGAMQKHQGLAATGGEHNGLHAVNGVNFALEFGGKGICHGRPPYSAAAR